MSSAVGSCEHQVNQLFYRISKRLIYPDLILRTSKIFQIRSFFLVSLFTFCDWYFGVAHKTNYFTWLSAVCPSRFCMYFCFCQKSRLFMHVKQWRYRSSQWRCSVKKLFLEISQNSQENSCARVSFLIKLQPWGKKRLWHRCFPLNFSKFLRTPLLQNTSGWLLPIVRKLSFYMKLNEFRL